MRSFLAYILLFSVMLPTISPWGTIAYFHLNREYIAKVLCENRQRPELKCNGQCYLAKKLKQQEDNKDKETTNRVQNFPVLQLFTQTVTTFKFSANNSYFLDNPLFFYQLAVYISPDSRLLRPPQV